MRGVLYGIGVGPGDPELMTLKAVKYMAKSDVIIIPAKPKEDCLAYRTARGACPEIEEKEIRCMPFLMSRNQEELQAVHHKIYEDISFLLEEGKTVAFLTIGDPSVYSTYSYIHQRELNGGGKPVMVSGIPSFCAAAAALGISLADNQEQIHMIPAAYEIEGTLSLKGTKVYMKSGKQLGRLKQMLLKEQEGGKYLVYSASECGLLHEKLSAGAENIDEEGGYLTLIIVKETDRQM